VSRDSAIIVLSASSPGGKYDIPTGRPFRPGKHARQVTGNRLARWFVVIHCRREQTIIENTYATI